MSHNLPIQQQEDDTESLISLVPGDAHPVLSRTAFGAGNGSPNFANLGGGNAMAAFSPMFLGTMGAGFAPTTAAAAASMSLAFQVPISSSYAVQSYLEQDRLNEPWVVGAAKLPVGPVVNRSAFANYRNTVSEYGHPTRGLLSDSGYGTGRHSVGIPSVYGDPDHAHETHSLAGHLDSFNLKERPKKRRWGGSVASSTARHMEPIVCRDCGKQVKTRSELKKHEARHNKAHVCEIRPCPRNGEPFSTTNDLDRHKKTVHGLNIPGPCYRCYITPCNVKDKVWRRADNFRQHLKRVHEVNANADFDLRPFEVMMDISPESPDPPPSATRAAFEFDIWPSLDTASQDITHAAHAETDAECLEGGPDLIPPELESRVNKTLRVVLGQQSPESQHTMTETTPIPVDVSDESKESPQDLYGFKGAQPDSMSPQVEVSPGPGGFDQMDDAIADLFSTRGGYFDQDLDPADLEHELIPHEMPRATRNLAEDPETDGALDPSFRDAARSMSNESPKVKSPKVESPETEYTKVESPKVESPPLESPKMKHAKVTFVEPDQGDEDSTEGVDGQKRAASPGEASPVLDSPMDISEEENADNAPPRTRLRFPLPTKNWAEEPDRAELFTFLSTIPRTVLERFLQITASAAYVPEPTVKEADPTSQSHECTECKKRFTRKCDLAKHVKRHDRPYSCTFPPCTKRFGSKNDWKRHETGQHLDVRVYTCEERNPRYPYQGQCLKTCPQRKDFELHLQCDHHITDPQRIERMLVRCNNVQRMESWFWCGFCRDNVDTKEGKSMFTERFDHIDDHFFGRNGLPKMGIEDWGPCPTNLQAGYTHPHNSSAMAAPGQKKRSLEASETPGQPGAKRVKREMAALPRSRG